MVESSATFPAVTPPLVGREREQAMLRDALASARAGRGSLVLIGGEAGIGKTTLAEWLLAEAGRQGALVLLGRCYDLAETPPYGPWVEALARGPHGDGLPDPPDFTGGGVASQAVLFAAARTYLATLAARQPLVLLLDDLHWADSATLGLLRTLARALADLPLLLLVTYRADELTRRHALYQLLPTLERETRAARLALRPLGEAAVRDLVGRYALPGAEADRLVAWLVRRAEGNAFFTAQLLRALEDEGALARMPDGWALGDLGAVGLPALLRQVLDARLDRLGEEARRLLAVAAVLGQEVPLALWATVAGTGEDGLLDPVERAVDARLLAETPDGMGVRFAHALIREALYEGTLALRRRGWHRRAAEALEAGPVPDPDAVAYHFRQAGDARAAGWLVRAAHRGEFLGAVRTAAERFEAAQALLEGDPAQAERRGWLLFRLAWVVRFADPPRCLAYLDEAVRLAAAAGNPALAIVVAAERAFPHYQLGAYGAVWQIVASALAAYDRLLPEQWAAGIRGYVDLFPEGAQRNDKRNAARLLRGIVEARRDLGVLCLAQAGHFTEALAIGEARLPFWSAGEWDAAGPENRPAVPSARPTPAYAANILLALGRTYAALGRPDAAQAMLRECRLDPLDAHGYVVTADTLAIELGGVALPYRADRVADRDRLAADMEAEYRKASEGGYAELPPPRALRHALLLVEGDWAGAEEAALAVLQRPTRHWWPDEVRATLGALARHRGQPDAAWTHVREVLPLGVGTVPGDGRFSSATELTRLAAALATDAGDLPTARAWLDGHDRWLAWSGATLGRAGGALGWAAYHRAAGDAAQALERAELALAQANAPRQPLALLAAHRLLGELATAEGRHADAAGYLAEALALAEACAAPYERALTLLALAELHLATGDRPQATSTLAEARALLEPLGARPALARAAALAAHLAATAAPPPATTLPFGLTVREVEVLRLVAQGLGNAEVGKRLFLSPRTVQQHLRSVYNKLGVDNRAAATRLAVERHLA